VRQFFGDGPNGQTGDWSEDGIIVIENPNDPDGGTVFRPTGEAWLL